MENKEQKEEKEEKEENTNQNKQYPFVALTADQKAVIQSFLKQENNLRRRYFDAARKLGELNEQKLLAENAERQLRGQLNQAETLRTKELTAFAKELGWNDNETWNYIDNMFGFEVVKGR